MSGIESSTKAHGEAARRRWEPPALKVLPLGAPAKRSPAARERTAAAGSPELPPSTACASDKYSPSGDGLLVNYPPDETEASGLRPALTGSPISIQRR